MFAGEESEGNQGKRTRGRTKAVNEKLQTKSTVVAYGGGGVSHASLSVPEGKMYAKDGQKARWK